MRTFQFVCILVIFFVQSVSAACRDDIVSVRGTWGQAVFAVTLADTQELRSKGLMFVKDMPARSGMLFIYDRPQRATFWMKNTLIPLDILFVDVTGTIRRVHHRAIPGDLTTIDGGKEIAYVLEINGGIAKRFGIAAGDVIQHPRISPKVAVWTC